MLSIRSSIFCLLAFNPAFVGAGPQTIKVVISKNIDNELHLEARQAPLREILGKLSNLTNVPIHYSMLPDASVTATCEGATVKPVLECLLNKKADMVFRFSQQAGQIAARQQPEEVWIVGNDFAAEQKRTSSYAVPETLTANTSETAPITANNNDTARLITMTSASDPSQRADAIALLAADEQMDDALVHDVLTDALSDQNAQVRAQAVDLLARRGGTAAVGVLQSALRDRDASVRIMAVDNAGDNTALLQQALADSEEAVSSYAATKLRELAGRQKPQ